MPVTFPTSRFGFLDQEIDVERQTLRGGTALSGDEDVTSADGGGRVFAEFSNGSLVDRDKIMAWSALLGILEEGVTPVVVPFCNRRYQPYGGEHRVPHSDGTPFDDGALYAGGGPVATAAGPVALRGTVIALNIAFARPLIGSEWFTVVHPNKQERAYKIRQIDSQTATTATVRFIPPMREAIQAGTVIDFRDPRCLMTQDGRASNRKTGRMTEAAIRFVEAR